MKKSNHKNITINDNRVLTDWKNAKVISPENIRTDIKSSANARNEILKQTNTFFTSVNC